MPITREQHQNWQKNRPKGSLTSKLVVRSNEGNVLLVKPTFREAWQLPGGSVETHETPIETAIREVHEELGIKVDKEHVVPVGMLPRRDYTILVYEYEQPVLEQADYPLHLSELKNYKFEHPDNVPSLLAGYYGEFWSAYNA